MLLLAKYYLSADDKPPPGAISRIFTSSQSNYLKANMNFRMAAFFSAALCLTSTSGFVGAETMTASELSPDIAQDYVHANTLLDVGGGRKMNLYCRGEGAVTVVFDSGLSDWSSSWALVQPQVATRTRACTYDRAGMGYSDPSNRPSTPFNIVDDLRHLINAAGIHAPVVLVGHSLGGFNMKLFAAIHPSEVAGLVLVDPSEERTEERIRAQTTAKFGEERSKKMFSEDENGASAWRAQMRDCAAAATKQDLDPLSELYKKCTDPVRLPLGALIAKARQVIQVRSAYQAAQASEALNSIYAPNPSFDEQYARVFGVKNALGNLPVIVLSHSIVDTEEPFSKEEQYVWLALHDQTTASSTRGTHRIVSNTHHNIEVDKPQAIVVAINDVLTMLSTAP
jgi:pimeloyl-ACP methyl ester carboxylesterase